MLSLRACGVLWGGGAGEVLCIIVPLAVGHFVFAWVAIPKSSSFASNSDSNEGDSDRLRLT